MKKIKWICLCMAVFFCATVLPLSAKTYVWVDQAGHTRKTKNRPRNHQVSRWISTSNVRQKKTRQKVEIYVTSWCPYCHKAADYFRKRNIPFKMYDIEKNRKAAARKKRLSGGRGGVPFVVVNGVAIHGYAPKRYGQALK